MIEGDRCAVFTMARSESVNLPVWLRYYRRHFASHNIYVLDHESTDGSTSGLAVKVVPVHNPVYNDNGWVVETAKKMQTELLEKYEFVLFSHPDEIVIADPKRYPGGLSEYIDRNGAPVVRCDGRGVVQNLSAEEALDWVHPVFQQRRWWYRDFHDCKPLLASQPLNWTWGFHNDGVDRSVDPDLLLVHLHRADLRSMLERHAWMRRQPFCEGQGNAGFHHKWSDEAVIRDMLEHQARMEPIPERFDGQIL